jgi:hypothetical protein
MEAIKNIKAELVTIKDPTKDWKWPADIVYVGGNVWSESNGILELLAKKMTMTEAITKFI